MASWFLPVLCFGLISVEVQGHFHGHMMNAVVDDKDAWFLVPWNHNRTPELQIDTAAFVIVSTLTSDLTLYAQSDLCFQCPHLKIGTISPGKNVTFIADTRFSIHFKVGTSGADNDTLCTLEEELEEYDTYYWYLNQAPGPPDLEENQCIFVKNSDSFDSNLPIYVALGVFGGLALIWILMRIICNKANYFGRFNVFRSTDRLINSDLGNPTPVNTTDGQSESVENTSPDSPPPQPKKERLRSLDTFRGLSLVVMIFVNYHGGRYWYFHHSAWNGITVADLVFPWFTFIMGTSIALAFRSLLRKNVSRKTLALKVLKRTAILFLFGLMISNNGGNAAVDLQTLRIPGVLQRLALSYFGVAMMEVFFAQGNDPYEFRWWGFARDIIPYWPEWLISIGILTIHLCLTFFLPVEGCTAGYLGPGGLHENGVHENCTGGASGYIDRMVFGANHMYNHPTCKQAYYTTVPYDPEGILGTLTSILTCFLGLQAGRIIITYKDWVQRIKRFILWGIVTGLIAGILCKFSQNDGWIPINKNLWSVSFVFCLSSMAFFLLTICYLLCDVFTLWSGTPFFYPGMNSIVVYMCHEVFNDYFPVQFKVSNTHAAQLAMNLYGATLWVIVSMLMYHKGVFVAI